MKHLSLLIAVIFCISNSLSVQANDNIITQTLIVEQNEKMEELLQKRDPKETINFLHSNISENAEFNIQVNNPMAQTTQTKQSFKMSKADYINSFITGMHYVDKYDVDIKTSDIQISKDQKTATVIEVMIEEGTILNAQNLSNPGLPFLSTTTCTKIYKIEAGKMQSNQAFCKTQTGEINTI